jgi:hypothetical protein
MFSRRARGVTPETGPPNILLSTVQQFITSDASYKEDVFQSWSSVKCCGVKRKIDSELLMCVCSKMIFCHHQTKAKLHKTGRLKSLQKSVGGKRNVSKIN